MFDKPFNEILSSLFNRRGRSRGWLGALLPIGIAACGGGGGSDYTTPSLSTPVAIPFPPADYSEVDAAFQSFLDTNETFDGISYAS